MDETVRCADAIAEIAKESTDDQTRDVAIWADALRASVHAHRRDFETLMPWAKRLWRATRSLLAGAPELSGLAEVPTLERLPQFCEMALRILKAQKAGMSPAAPILTR